MLDATGTELMIGQKVVVSYGEPLRIGVVTRFTSRKVEVEFKSYGGWTPKSIVVPYKVAIIENQRCDLGEAETQRTNYFKKK